MPGSPAKEPRRRSRPQVVVVVIGAAAAVVVALSYAAATTFGFHDDSPIRRQVFENIPDWYQVVFYTATTVLIFGAGWLLGLRARNWARGAPDRRPTTRANVRRRLRDLRSAVFMRTLLRDPAAGAMHSLIYVGFLVLLAVTTTLEVDQQMPDGWKFLHGDVYRSYAAIGDAAGVVFLAGLSWAVGRRYIRRVYRIRIKTKPEHAAILGIFILIGITGFTTEMLRIALDGRPPFERWSFVGYPLSGLVDGWSRDAIADWHQISWWVHVGGFFAFLIALPTTMLRHMVTSPLNMYLSDRQRPKGAMRAMPNLAESDLETFGAATVEDMTWKQLLDTDACTICGRCTSVCPAHATGKPLDPREIVLKTGEVMAATGSPVVSPPVGVVPEITISADSLFERITPEELWACTACRACDEVCPVDIEILDKILDMRRYLSLMESNFPAELGHTYRAIENQRNPWGMNQRDRAAWADGLDVPVIAPGDALDHEYLYFVGCAGSFDDKNQRVARATAQLLQRAGVDFAILGPSELCNGDPARRSGNEYLFQMLAMQNIETMNAMGARKVITQCPHCFNTLMNEYPQLGGHWEVVHHSQLLESLIDSGRLDVSGARLDERITYHDSCYLGRHNPRVLLQVLRPGLRNLGRRLALGGSFDDVDHEIVALAWERIRTYPIERRPGAIAANVLLDVRKRYVRVVLGPERLRLEYIRDDLWPTAPSAEHEAIEAFGPSLRRAHACLAAAVDRGAISLTSASVVWRTRVQQDDDAEVAADLGVNVRTLQRRRQRAERRLAAAS